MTRLYTSEQLRETAAYYRNAAQEAEKVGNSSAADDFNRTAVRFEAKATQQVAIDLELAHKLFDQLDPHTAENVEPFVRSQTEGKPRLQQDAVIDAVRALDPDNLAA